MPLSGVLCLSQPQCFFFTEKAQTPRRAPIRARPNPFSGDEHSTAVLDL